MSWFAQRTQRIVRGANNDYASVSNYSVMPFHPSPLFAELSRGLHAIDYLVVLIYLLGVLGTGWYFSRQQHQGEDYFVAGRRMPWFAVGLSIVATMLSTVTYLAAPGEVIRHGLALSIGWLALPLAFLVVNFLWIPFFMRLGVTSIYEYLERRFGLAARLTGALLFVFILRLMWMATIVLTASRAVAQITHPSVTQTIPFAMTLDQWTLAVLLSVGILATVYTMLGGIKAVIWTDVAQFVVLFGGVVLTLAFIAWDTGTGPVEWWRTATDDSLSGHQLPPLYSWDITERNTILFTVLNVVFWYSCTFIADQVAVQRYLTVPSVSAAVRGNLVNFLADFVTMILLAVCGMALLTYYLDPAFQTEILAGISDPRDPQVADKVFPHYIAHRLPMVASGLVVAALFAVAMSSLDSGVNSVSAVLTIDVICRLRPPNGRSSELRLARLITLVVGTICTVLAWIMLNIPEHYNIIGITARTFNCALGPLAAMFAAGMFLPRCGQNGVILSALVGLAVAIGAAWWVELTWVLGMTEFAQLEDATSNLRGPSPFLITPLAATSAFGLAWLLGMIFPVPSTAGSQPTWRKVVLEGERSQPQ